MNDLYKRHLKDYMKERKKREVEIEKIQHAMYHYKTQLALQENKLKFIEEINTKEKDRLVEFIKQWELVNGPSASSEL